MVTGCIDSRTVLEYGDMVVLILRQFWNMVTGCVDARRVLEYGDRLCRYQDSSGI